MSLAFRLIHRLPLPRETRLYWQANMLDREFGRAIRAARAKKDPNAVRSLESEHQFESEMLSQESEVLHTRKLLRKARRLRVAIPTHGEESGFWEQAQYADGWHLTATGYTSIRDAIRKELLWRREQRAHWVTFLSTIIGILGALTGLVAVFRT